jgi:hypothetical protein
LQFLQVVSSILKGVSQLVKGRTGAVSTTLSTTTGFTLGQRFGIQLSQPLTLSALGSDLLAYLGQRGLLALRLCTVILVGFISIMRIFLRVHKEQFYPRLFVATCGPDPETPFHLGHLAFVLRRLGLCLHHACKRQAQGAYQ